MKRKQIPVIVMLAAGAVTSVTTRLMRYELETALWILLTVLIVFYIAGCLLERTINKFEEENIKQEEAEEDISDEGEVIKKEASEDVSETKDA